MAKTQTASEKKQAAPAAATENTQAATAQAGEQNQGGEQAGQGDQGEQAQAGEQQPPVKPSQAPAKAQPAKPKVIAEAHGNQSDEAIELLLEACGVFGINPDPDVRPVELLSWRYYREDVRTDTPAKVVVVTAGGQKLAIWEDPDVPLEQDTEEILRNIFGAWRVDPVTKLKVPGEMPDDLTLPRSAVTGISDSQAHVYKGGYLRSGGRREAAKRDAVRRGGITR